MRVVLAVLALAIATPAMAQTPCAPSRAAMADALTTGKYQEQPTFMGVTGGPGLKFEMWVNAGTGTWTATLEQPTGQTCIIAAGDGFGPAMAAQPPGEGL